jgi:hypothetical protein
VSESEPEPVSGSVERSTRRAGFSVRVQLSGIVLLVLGLVSGLVTFYFLAWGVGEEEGGPAARAASRLLLAGFAVYALVVAPLLWPRAAGVRTKALVLAPHAGFVTLAVFGMIRG